MIDGPQKTSKGWTYSAGNNACIQSSKTASAQVWEVFSQDPEKFYLWAKGISSLYRVKFKYAVRYRQITLSNFKVCTKPWFDPFLLYSLCCYDEWQLLLDLTYIAILILCTSTAFSFCLKIHHRHYMPSTETHCAVIFLWHSTKNIEKYDKTQSHCQSHTIISKGIFLYKASPMTKW